jgi:hypothetical protein
MTCVAYYLLFKRFLLVIIDVKPYLFLPFFI